MLLQQVPAIELEALEREPDGPDGGADIVARVNAAGRRRTLLCEVKSNGQPRYVRMALLQLQNHVSRFGTDAIPILIAPYLSPEARVLCEESRVGFLDLYGNARLVFDGVFIDRAVPDKPPTEQRDLKSIFSPKAAQVLRVMLRDPRLEWRVANLAEAADVSLGHVSNVRKALLDREWAEAFSEGVALTDPDAVLDAWRDVYKPLRGECLRFYTTLHGAGLEEAARHALVAGKGERNAVFASFSAARWLAPYGRVGTDFFYADEAGLLRLEEALQPSSISKGENIVVTVLKDRGVFRDCIEPAPGIVCTSEVQTYLDLAAAGERGREAADHLRRNRLTWHQ
jgi:hypothetical protein